MFTEAIPRALYRLRLVAICPTQVAASDELFTKSCPNFFKPTYLTDFTLYTIFHELPTKQTSSTSPHSSSHQPFGQTVALLKEAATGNGLAW